MAELFRQIPDHTLGRNKRFDYDSIPIDASHPLHDDPLVDLREFDIVARSYYASPNKMTGEPLPGIPDAPLVRSDLACRLRAVDQFLKTSSDVRDVLGGPAALSIADAYRPAEVQMYAYEVAWPAIIRAENPSIGDEELDRVRAKCIKRPSGKPTPHATGGAVDTNMINPDTGDYYWRGEIKHTPPGSAYPEYYEAIHEQPAYDGDIEVSDDHPPANDEKARITRRVLYYAMTEVGGLYVNPTEIWHYGIGDALSARLSGNEVAYYGQAEVPDWYRKAMDSFAVAAAND